MIWDLTDGLISLNKGLKHKTQAFHDWIRAETWLSVSFTPAHSNPGILFCGMFP